MLPEQTQDTWPVLVSKLPVKTTFEPEMAVSFVEAMAVIVPVAVEVLA